MEISLFLKFFYLINIFLNIAHSLRSEVERLQSEMQYRLLEQERILRKELVESFEKKLEEKEKDHEQTLKHELQMQQRLHDLKV